ncbi:hypothetical protein B0H10DRAFT_2206992 [Mycena sp. CBHHK59/15]|nr:hypothetical protein B0H10DRAFT_2206992 [Mycena sp. CBHHK59/15]
MASAVRASVPDTLINAAHMRARQGRMSVIFICDDGMQLISEEDRQERRSAWRSMPITISDEKHLAGLEVVPIALVPLLNPQDRKRHLQSMYTPDGMSNPINMVCSARMPSCADRRDTLYTYRDAGLYTNDGHGAIYTGVRVKEDDVEGWFAGNLNTTQLLEGAKGGKDIIIWLCMYEVDEHILAEAAIHNTYIAMGALCIVRTCLRACCCVKHREFFSLAKIGGLCTMDRTIRPVLAYLGQPRICRYNFLLAL